MANALTLTLTLTLSLYRLLHGQCARPVVPDEAVWFWPAITYNEGGGYDTREGVMSDEAVWFWPAITARLRPRARAQGGGNKGLRPRPRARAQGGGIRGNLVGFGVE